MHLPRSILNGLSPDLREFVMFVRDIGTPTPLMDALHEEC